MDSNQKKFGIYVFFSTFSRNLIEVFIPVILYKFGFPLNHVIFYYLMVNFFSLLLTYPLILLSTKINNKILSIIGIFSFIMLQIFLNYMNNSVIYIIIIALLFAVYRRGYWISRRYYNLMIMKEDNIGKTYSIISIINQIGVIISAYIGSLILDYISLKMLTIISIILFISSIIPLYMLKFKNTNGKLKLELLENIKQIPKSNLYLFGSYELINVIKFLIPLYLFIYVKNNYQTIGFVNLITNFALILFTYMYGKKLDKSKNNYIKLAIILTVLIYLVKVNVTGYILFLVSFIEGIVIKMYELSINKGFFTLSKKFEFNNYNLIYELIQNSFRTTIVFILYITNFNIKTMIYFTLAFVLFGVLLNFKLIDDKNNLISARYF